MELEEEILLFLKDGMIKEKYIIAHFVNKGIPKEKVKESLEDLYFYGFILKRPTMKRNENVYYLTEKGRMEAEALEEERVIER
ncbi:hypothetical protein [Saccharolobus islandicus]|uniref:DUF2250 domain-containing protein n=1 Tax=Saccharolobus islandicus (strain M.16.4 / Kamchatka \|nr:hypothetical protein [Sulfolobus islandicus]ACR42217.1 hypothetical protein M164_1616 [Sulfolobus islandicus M.16.4]